jgi:hypothetical protein
MVQVADLDAGSMQKDTSRVQSVRCCLLACLRTAHCWWCRYMVQVADLEASTDTESALTPAPAYLEGQPGTIDCINVRVTAV